MLSCEQSFCNYSYSHEPCNITVATSQFHGQGIAVKGVVIKTFQDFLHIMDFIGNQTVQDSNESFSAASKGFN